MKGAWNCNLELGTVLDPVPYKVTIKVLESKKTSVSQREVYPLALVAIRSARDNSTYKMLKISTKIIKRIKNKNISNTKYTNWMGIYLEITENKNV